MALKAHQTHQTHLYLIRSISIQAQLGANEGIIELEVTMSLRQGKKTIDF